jgi:hypothetical protein
MFCTPLSSSRHHQKLDNRNFDALSQNRIRLQERIKTAPAFQLRFKLAVEALERSE